MGYIYRITNTINKKVYIGQTIQETVEKRWNLHKHLAGRNKGCTALKEAFKKYGIDKFKFEVLIICFNEDCIAYEKEYIKKYNSIAPNGYNISAGGDGGAFFKGKKHTEETKKILSEKIKKHYSDPENIRKNIPLIKEGMNKSEKWKAVKNNKKENPRTWDEDVKTKISEGMNKYYKENKEKHAKIVSEKLGQKIIQYDINNTYICNYPSIAEAVRQTGTPKTSIQYCILGKMKTAGGFIWKRSENNT
jgi:group I intron endonuclease